MTTRLQATHFIEVICGRSSVQAFNTDVYKIHLLNDNLKITTLYSELTTIAIWKIKLKPGF